MAILNTVDSVDVDLYCGEDQAIWYLPVTTNDESGIAVASWTISARFYNQRLPPLPSASIPTAITNLTLSYDATDGYFKGTNAAATSAVYKSGLWTIDIWRTNSGAKKVLLRCNVNMYPAISA